MSLDGSGQAEQQAVAHLLPHQGRDSRIVRVPCSETDPSWRVLAQRRVDTPLAPGSCRCPSTQPVQVARVCAGARQEAQPTIAKSGAKSGHDPALNVGESATRDSSTFRRIEQGRVQCVKVHQQTPPKTRAHGAVLRFSHPDHRTCSVEFCVGTRDGSSGNEIAPQKFPINRNGRLTYCILVDALSRQGNCVRWVDRDSAMSAQELDETTNEPFCAPPLARLRN